MLADEQLQSRLRLIAMLVLDVDGVMTDGDIILMSVLDTFRGEIKRFDVHDGSAVVFLKRAGIETAVISGRKSDTVRARARELDISAVYQGYKWKLDAWQELLKDYPLRPEQICCMGDDLHDLPLMRRAGLVVAVANARPEVKAAAHYVTQASGGRGAVREIAEIILKAQGKWDALIARYQS